LALADEPWIVGGRGGPCLEGGLAACKAAGFAPDVPHTVDDFGALLRLVAAGCGVELVPDLAVSSVPPSGVVLRPRTASARAVTSRALSAPAQSALRASRR